MSRRASARLTHNFERNLEGVERFLDERDAAAAFDDLLTLLLDTTLPAIERFPEIGADLLIHRPQSHAGMARIAALRDRLGEGAALREYIVGDYILLYAVVRGRVYFLAIKHHRQLSFDLRGHWQR